MIDGEDLPTGEPEFINGTGGDEAPAPEPEARETEPAKAEEPAAEEPEAEDKPDEGEKPKQTPWFQRRIDELTRQRYDEQRRREALEAEVASLRQQPVPEGEKPPQQPQKALTQTDIEARAAALVQQREFDNACNKTFEDGVKAYPDFQASLENFRMLGGLKPELVEAAMETGDAAKVLYELGKNPDEASRIMGMSAARMGAAVAKILAKAAPAPAPLSKAPAPIKPINGSGKVEVDPSRLSAEEWMKRNPLPVR